VVDPVQRQVAEHEVEAPLGHRQPLFVATERCEPVTLACCARHRRRQIRLRKPFDLWIISQQRAERACVTAEFNRAWEGTRDVEHPIAKTRSALFEDKIRRAEAGRSAVAAPADKSPIEHEHAVRHGAVMAFLAGPTKDASMSFIATASKVLLDALLPP